MSEGNRRWPWEVAITLGVLAMLAFVAVFAVRGVSDEAVAPAFDIATTTCRVRSMELSYPQELYADVPFEVALVAPVEVSLRPQPHCPVKATLTAPTLLAGPGDREVDLALSAPKWVLSAEEPGNYDIDVLVDAVDECVQVCADVVPLRVSVVIDRNVDSAAARTALEATIASLELTVIDENDEPLRVGQASPVQFTIKLPAGADVSQVSPASLAVSHDDEEVQRSELSDSASFSIVVIPAQPHDYEELINVTLEGAYLGEPMVAARRLYVPVDVAEESWFRRHVINNLEWIGGSLAALVIIIGWFTPLRTTLRGYFNRRRRTKKPDDGDYPG